MHKKDFLQKVGQLDETFASIEKESCVMPQYTPEKHYLDVAQSEYFKVLTVLRHNIKRASDFYWSNIVGAYNVDLFMMTSSVSSPMGPGSDSEAIHIKFGNLDTNLVDSSQFGFEPLLMNGFDALYCYLPSMRGEDPDKRHLNQFYHCEAEIKGDIDKLYPLVDGFVRFLSEVLLNMPNSIKLISEDSTKTNIILRQTLESRDFKQISFDKAVSLLKSNNSADLINETKHGVDISAEGEEKLLEILKTNVPVWVTGYDRDRVPFYQKPDVNNKDKVINADMIFPKIGNGFGGEIIGCGQRQDDYQELKESIIRQELDWKPYEWYMNLRNMENYETTSGFGLGIERFIAWALGRDDIKDVILYPRIKGVVTHP